MPPGPSDRGESWIARRAVRNYDLVEELFRLLRSLAVRRPELISISTSLVAEPPARSITSSRMRDMASSRVTSGSKMCALPIFFFRRIAPFVSNR